MFTEIPTHIPSREKKVKLFTQERIPAVAAERWKAGNRVTATGNRLMPAGSLRVPAGKLPGLQYRQRTAPQSRSDQSARAPQSRSTRVQELPRAEAPRLSRAPQSRTSETARAPQSRSTETARAPQSSRSTRETATGLLKSSRSTQSARASQSSSNRSSRASSSSGQRSSAGEAAAHRADLLPHHPHLPQGRAPVIQNREAGKYTASGCRQSRLRNRKKGDSQETAVAFFYSVFSLN